MSLRILTAALAVILGVLVTLPARADLIIRGGTPAQQASVRSFYQALPACCHACQVCVQLLSNQEMDAYLRAAEGSQASLYRNSAIDGLYQDTLTTVTLRVSTPECNVTPGLAHEYGHYVWDRVLSQDQRHQYEQVYKIQRDTHHLITPYAAQSVEEGFAEAYSFFIRQHDALVKCDPQSCQCLACFLQPPSSTMSTVTTTP